MGDSAVWVAALTGGTAVLASWVTILGNVRAAKTQAETSAEVQHREKVRELRRAAYLDVMEQAHVTTQLHYRVGDAYVQLDDHEAFLARVQELREQLRAAFDPLMRCVRVVVLEGPPPVAEAAQAVLRAASAANSALARVSNGEPDARTGFDTASRGLLDQLEQFVAAARGAMSVS